MKVFTVLSVAAAASAFVLPGQFSIDRFRLEQSSVDQTSVWDKLADPQQSWDEIKDKISHAAKCMKDRAHEAVDYTAEAVSGWEEAFSVTARDAWYEATTNEESVFLEPPPHDGPPHHGPPHHGPPHGKPHHPPHRGPPNQTVYELIASSKYTTKLAALINEFPDLVEALNGTKANYTVFAPTDRAFEKIPEDAPKPPKEFLKKVLLYHVSPKFYPAGRVLVTRTIPMALGARYIEGEPQRVSTQVGLRGLTVNFYARIVAVDIFGTNGVIHGLDSILLPPPTFTRAISAFPGKFSTFELALRKTGMWDHIVNSTGSDGFTAFVPDNNAFQRLGPRLNAFLFSPRGVKYLKSLMEYHGGPYITLYSDAIYNKSPDKDDMHGGPRHRIPKGLYHIDFPTVIGKKLSIDIARYGRFISMKANGFVKFGPLDACLADGVAHVSPFVLIPPKELGSTQSDILTEEMSVDELKERLAPYVDEDDEVSGEEEYNMDL